MEAKESEEMAELEAAMDTLTLEESAHEAFLRGAHPTARNGGVRRRLEEIRTRITDTIADIEDLERKESNES